MRISYIKKLGNLLALVTSVQETAIEWPLHAKRARFHDVFVFGGLGRTSQRRLQKASEGFRRIKKWSLPKPLFKQSCILEKITNQLLKRELECMRNKKKIEPTLFISFKKLSFMCNSCFSFNLAYVEIIISSAHKHTLLYI